MATTKKEYTVQSVDRTLDIIEALLELKEARTEDIVEHTGYSKSSVYNHLTTLKEREYVVEEGSIYRLSLHFLKIGNSIRSMAIPQDTIKNHVKQTAKDTGEVVSFHVKENDEGVFLFRETSEHPIKTAKIGKRVPLYATAAGKAILAHLPSELVDQVLDRQELVPFTENTITDRGKLHEELDEIASRGYAINRGERIERLRSIAAPIRDSNDYPIGSLAITGPRHQMSGQRLEEELPKTLLARVDEIELDISYP